MKVQPTYHDSIWFCTDDATIDWQAKLYREGGRWKVDYRFRYYDGDQTKNPHEDGDTKRWYFLEAEDDSETTLIAMRKALRRMAELIAVQFDKAFDVIEMQCRNDEEQFMQKLSSRPWLHLRIATPEEVRELVERGRA